MHGQLKKATTTLVYALTIVDTVCPALMLPGVYSDFINKQNK